MQVTPRRIAILTFGLVVSATLGGIAFQLFGDSIGGLMGASKSKQERLFDKVGVQPIEPPVQLDNFRLRDVHGNSVALSDFRGKVVFLNFWTTWCAPCRIEMPDMERLHRRLRHKKFVLVAVSMKEPGNLVSKYLQANKLSFRTLLDEHGALSRSLGVFSIPVTFIIDKQGRIIGNAIGPREWAGNDAISLFDYLASRPEEDSS